MCWRKVAVILCDMVSFLCVYLQAYYYSAIVEDVLLRFSWTLTVTLSTVSGIHGISDILATVLAPMEVFRYANSLWFFFHHHHPSSPHHLSPGLLLMDSDISNTLNKQNISFQSFGDDEFKWVQSQKFLQPTLTLCAAVCSHKFCIILSDCNSLNYLKQIKYFHSHLWSNEFFFYIVYHPCSQHSLSTVFFSRRFVWNFFRLENEHLNNCGEFRAVRDISVAPLNADDQTLLEQMMDQDDGVRNRQGKKSWKRSYSMSLRRPRLASQWVPYQPQMGWLMLTTGRQQTQNLN